VIEAAELRALVDGLAKRFENRVHHTAAEREVGVSGASGWGQFLDDPTEQTQVGPYGTSAGLIVRVLANRGSDELAQQVALSVNTWWANRDKDVERKQFAQTTRLAMMHLAIRLAAVPSTQTTISEMQTLLLQSIRPDGMWGNYLSPSHVQDPSPRLFATAIAILSFTLFLPPTETVSDQLIHAATGLEAKLLGTTQLPLLHFAAACAAILSAKRTATDKRVLSRMRKVAYGTQPSLRDLGVYFYDYEYLDEKGDSKYHRDYFIIPTEILLGIAGFQPGAPVYLRVRAELSLKTLIKNIRGFDGLYRPDNEQRVSSMNQCWVAIYLSLAAMHRERAIASGALYGFIRQRPDSVWTDALMLLLCSGGIVFGIWYQTLPGVSRTGTGAVILQAFVAVLAFISGRLYAPAFLKEIFTGRE
jgi:hypothetical protein